MPIIKKTVVSVQLLPFVKQPAAVFGVASLKLSFGSILDILQSSKNGHERQRGNMTPYRAGKVHL